VWDIFLKYYLVCKLCSQKLRNSKFRTALAISVCHFMHESYSPYETNILQRKFVCSALTRQYHNIFVYGKAGNCKSIISQLLI